MARKRYNKGKRVDMRQGGRVALARGRRPEDEIEDQFGQLSKDPSVPPKIEDKRISISQPLPTTPAVREDYTGLPQNMLGIKKDPMPAPEKERPQTTFISQPEPVPLKQLSQSTQQVLTGPNAQTSREDTMQQAAVKTSAQQQQPRRTPPTEQTSRGYQVGDIETITLDNGDTQTMIMVDPGPPPDWQPYNDNTPPPDDTPPDDTPPDEQPPVDEEGNIIYDSNRIRDSIDWATSADPSYAQRETEEQRRSREIVQEAAEGKMPSAALTPDAVQAGFQRDAEGNLITDEEGRPIPLAEAEVQEMAELTAAQAGVAEMPTEERVAGAETTAVGAPETIQAASYDAQQVSEEVIIDPATGTLSPEARAELEEKAITYAASGVTFSQQQKDQGIIDRVVGTLDNEAMASAAKVAGTTLPKVLRAKEQLRNAGLSEEDIVSIGNDPQDLEDRLMDFTAEQRGMVGNLPEEALVGKQIEGLLEGMENGEVPIWARPAVSAVNQMMAARGLDASTVGRDNLFNAVIQAAMPIASQNAQTIKESAMQQTNIEAQAEQTNAQMRQQTAIRNADKVFNLNMAQFNADQQRELANKKFLQTVSMTEVSNEQQSVIQNAVNQTQLDLANLNTQEKLAVQNAQAFLSMDMANLNNDQQARMVKSQQEQQRLLSNQSAENAAAQFNSASENQTNQFMTNLSSQIQLNNAQRADAVSQFNTAQENAAEARRVGIQADINKTNATLFTQIEQFNSQQEFNRNQFNTQNAMIIEQSNVEWRRKSNTINTAAQNAINQQNAQNAFGLSSQAMSFLWQEMRDQASYIFQASENQANRKAQLMATALQNEAAAEKGFGSYNAASSLITNFFGLSKTGDI